MNKKSLRYGILTVLTLLSHTCDVRGQSRVEEIGNERYEHRADGWHRLFENGRSSRIQPDRITVRVESNGRLEEIDFSAIGLSGQPEIVLERYAGGFYSIRVPEGLDPFAFARQLHLMGRFDTIMFPIVGTLTASPNDAYFVDQWGLSSAKINMPSAWNISTGNHDVVVAILDNGVDYGHPDLMVVYILILMK